MAAEVSITLLAEVAKATSDIKKFSADSAKEAKKVSDAFDVIGVAAKAAFAFFAAGELVRGLKDVVSAAARSADTIQSLNIALASAGQLSAGSSEEMRKFADEIEKTTKFSDDAVLSTAAYIEQLAKLDTQGLKRATSAALDLSAALGRDLASTQQLVAKAANGNTEALNRLGIKFQKGKTDAETFNNALLAIESRFGGTAAQSVNTFTGATAQLGNAFEQIEKQLGGFIVQNPLVIKIIQTLSGIFQDLVSFLQKNQAAIDSFITQGIIALAKAFSFLIGPVQLFVDVLLNIENVIGLARASILGFVAAFTGLGPVKAILEALVQSLLFAATAVLDVISALSGISVVSNTLKAAGVDVDGLKATLGGLQKQAIKTASEFDGGSLSRGLSTLKDKQFGLIDSTTKLKTSLDGSFESIKGGSKDLIDSLTELGDNFERQGEKSRKAINNVTQSLKELTDEQIKALQSNPFAGPNGLIGANVSQVKVSPGTQQAGAIAGGLATNVLGGEAGAVKIAGQIGTALGTALLGPIGAVVGPVLEVFAKGPEAAAGFVKGFIDSIPQIIENIILAIPDVIIALVEGLSELPIRIAERVPEIIQAFIAKLPELFVALTNALGPLSIQFGLALAKQAPFIAISFVDALVKEAPRFVTEMIKSIGSGVGGSIFGGNSGGLFGGGGFLGLGFAEGGIVPQGFPNDKFPARLTSGELVIDRSTVDKLNQFIDSQGQSRQTVQGGVIQVNLQLGEKELASVLLDLNQRGFRTA